MEQHLTASLLAVMANPALAAIETLRIEDDIDTGLRALMRAARGAGFQAEPGGTSGPIREVLIAAPPRVGKGGGEHGFAPCLHACLRRERDGAVWLSYRDAARTARIPARGAAA